MCRPEMMQECLDNWSNLGLDYQAKYWEKSVHAAHLILHREEYLSTFNEFYEKTSKCFEINDFLALLLLRLIMTFFALSLVSYMLHTICDTRYVILDDTCKMKYGVQ